MYGGNTRFVDKIIRYFFKLPPGFSITRDVPKAKFFEPPVIVNLPREYLVDYDPIKYYRIFRASVESLNVQILDFLTSLFSLDKDTIFSMVEQIGIAISLNTNPEDQLTMYTRFPSLSSLDNIGLEPLVVQIRNESNEYSTSYTLGRIIIREQGNIPYILCAISLPVELNKEVILSEIPEISYPLTRNIVSSLIP